MEIDSLSERILSDLNVIFKKDSPILEFDIIPVEDSLCNKSPVIHVDHRIALESWCVKHVYQYSYKKFINSRFDYKISKQAIHEWTRILLLINPEFTTAWNARKDLVDEEVLNASDELSFSELVLTRKPKSADNFIHREWLLKYIISNETIDQNLITNELRVSLDAASRYQRNYYAWTHRIWILKHLCKDSLDILHCELIVTKSWIESHISDYSGLQYRQFIFDHLNKHFVNSNHSITQNDDFSSKDFFGLLLNELEMLNGFMNLYSDQESLFIHRRIILILISKWFPNNIKQIKNSEITFIDESVSKGYSNCRLNQWQFELIRRHVNYLKRTLNWDFDSL